MAKKVVVPEEVTRTTFTVPTELLGRLKIQAILERESGVSDLLVKIAKEYLAKKGK